MWLIFPRFCSSSSSPARPGTNFISVMPSFDPVPLTMSLVVTPVSATDWKRSFSAVALAFGV